MSIYSNPAKAGFFYALEMKQQYDNYTAEDHEVWSILFERQMLNLENKVKQDYLDCVQGLYPAFNPQTVPSFEEIDQILMGATQWEIQVVPGLIPVEDFFALLADRKWCSSTWLRKKSQLDYIEEPDMFHDVFGHLPLLMNSTYASFMQRFGELGVKHLNDKQVLTALQRLYWYTIEFGLSKREGKTEIYGAGIISSSGETHHVYNDPIEVKPFDVIEVINLPFENDVIQNTYVQIQRFEDLYQSLDILERRIETGLKVTPGIVR